MRPLFCILSVIVFALCIEDVSAGCYKNWSRCTPQTSFGTGILWKSCPDYCRRCKGRASGACKKANTGVCSGGYQCQCSGGSVKKSSNPVVKLTCKMGL